jgi:16S rRNA (guanine(966)-N(2))-methyltransferase RsmD
MEEGGRVRIIGGSAKGRRLATLRTFALRPTPDRVRQALLNILGDQIANARVADFFAGTGAIGLEALSRGARAVLFVEAHEPACRVIEKNLHTCGVHERATVWRADVLKTLPVLKAEGARFDVMFLDPPFRTPLVEDTLEQLGDGLLLAPEGLVVVEHFFKRLLQQQYGRLSRVRVTRFGDVTLSFYQAVPSPLGSGG